MFFLFTQGLILWLDVKLLRDKSRDLFQVSLAKLSWENGFTKNLGQNQTAKCRHIGGKSLIIIPSTLSLWRIINESHHCAPMGENHRPFSWCCCWCKCVFSTHSSLLKLLVWQKTPPVVRVRPLVFCIVFRWPDTSANVSKDECVEKTHLQQQQHQENGRWFSRVFKRAGATLASRLLSRVLSTGLLVHSGVIHYYSSKG